MNKDDFLKCLPNSEDLENLIVESSDIVNKFTDFDDFQVGLREHVEGQIENFEYEKKMKEKK